jgi:zinc transport system substrate-binding protein
MGRRIIGLLCVWWLLAPGPAQAAAKLKVVTSFLPVYCFAVNVAGDLAEVENLLPSGVGPHDYQFAPRDLRKLTAADLFVVNGLGVEDWLGRVVQAVGTSGKPVMVEISAGLKAELILLKPGTRVLESGHGHDHAPANSHIWLDPKLAAHAVTNILKAFQKRDPANAAGYAANAEKYLARLQALDQELATALASVKTQPLITYHNAFPYFTRRYGLNLVGVVEETPDIEPSPQQRTALMKLIREKRVKVIFTEPQFTSKLARQIAQDAGVALAELDTLETGPLTPTAYETGLRRNATVLQRHLK